MFLQGHLYQASLPQVKFQMPATYANKQCILVYKQQHVYFVMSNNSGLIRLLGLIKISCKHTHLSVTRLISETAFVLCVLCENFQETTVLILQGNLRIL